MTSQDDELPFQPLSAMEAGWTRFKLAFARPWRRIEDDSVLVFEVWPALLCHG